MAGFVDMMPTSTKNTNGENAMFSEVHVAADGDDNIIDYHDPNLLSKNIFLPSRSRQQSMEKNWNKKGLYISTKGGRFRPSDLMCSQFPTDTNSAVGVDVSCGALSAFSKEVPYNSAGLSVVSPVDTNPNGFVSQNTRRRKRPTRISSMPASPTYTDTDRITVQRRLRTSDVNLPTRSRVSSFRSSSKGVERFNYAKALLRSDYELEKLSRKIRSEINESELYELAQAAEKAADLGVDNFTGIASTFEGERRRQREDDFAKTTKTLPDQKQVTGSDMATQSSLAKIPRTSPSVIRKSVFDDDDKNSSGVLDQSLFDHARAAAAAVAVSAPAVQLQTSARKLIRKEPERRSMGIESLRDVNEVIPLWKELHSHMRTHFHRANVETNSLFFCESKTLPPPSKKSVGGIDSKGRQKSANHQRKSSFFGKLLPNFRSNESPRNEEPNNNSHRDSIELGTDEKVEPDTLLGAEFGCIGSSHVSPKKEDFGKMQSTDPSTLQQLVSVDEEKECNNQASIPDAHRNSEKGHNRQGHATSLTPRLPKESFDLEVFQITKNAPASPERPSHDRAHDESHSGDEDDIDSDTDSEDEQNYTAQKGGRDSSISSLNYEPLSPISPGRNSIVDQSSPRFASHLSSIAPSTPTNNVIPRRKDSGFSTPAHLRIIKRLHTGSSDNMSPTTDCVDKQNPENFQSSKLQENPCISPPANGVYSHFEPNSIVQNPSGSSTQQMLHVESHLAIPTIQSFNSDKEHQKFHQNFSPRNIRTQSKSHFEYSTNSLANPTASVSNMSLSSSKQKLSDGNEGLSPGNSNIKTRSEAGNGDDANGDSKSLSELNPNDSIDQPLELPVSQLSKGVSLASKIEDSTKEKSDQNVQCDKGIDEKKECDSEASTLNLNPYNMGKEKDQSVNIDRKRHSLGSPHMPNVEECERQIGTKKTLSSDTGSDIVSLNGKKNCDVQCSPLENQFVSDLRKRIEKSKNSSGATPPGKKSTTDSKLSVELAGANFTAESKDVLSTRSIHKGDGRNLETASVCHSIPPTEVSFKTAVQTVQGVAVQTVQEVFSHLSLGSPRNELEMKDWHPERDNKEFLSNYFYCSKSVMGKNLLLSSVENLSDTEVEQLVCAEPCNARESPCYLFGIDTMCGGLMDVLPHNGNVNSISRKEQEGEDTKGDLSQTPTRDRSSSISMGQINRSRLNSQTGANVYQERGEGTWLGMFQKAASERLNLQFQKEENELEKSKHPYTPPVLSRRLPNPSQTL